MKGRRPGMPHGALTLHMNALGEAVFALPLLHALKHAEPPWETVCVIRPDVGEILKASGLADKVIPRRPGISGFLRLAAEVRCARPEVCLAMSTSASNCLLARISGARRRIGYDRAELPRLLETVRFEGGGVRNYLSLLPPLGMDPTVESYCGLLRIPEDRQDQADCLLAGEGVGPEETFIAVSPISTGKLGVKVYPVESWRDVCRRLAESGLTVVLVGSRADLDLHKEIMSGGRGRIVSLAGRTPPLTLAGVLRRGMCVVGVDTGPIHVAAAVGVRCVTIFGPSNPRRTAPSGEGHVNLFAGLDCQPCLDGPCKRNGLCLSMIGPQDVVDAVLGVVSAGAGGSVLDAGDPSHR